MTHSEAAAAGAVLTIFSVARRNVGLQNAFGRHRPSNQNAAGRTESAGRQLALNTKNPLQRQARVWRHISSSADRAARAGIAIDRIGAYRTHQQTKA